MTYQLKSIAVAALLFAGIATVSAQTQTTEDFRKRAPQPLAARTINLPKPVETKLSNGMTLVVVEDKRLPIATMRLLFRNGGANDPTDAPGLASFTAGMLTQGTTTRSDKQIAAEVESLGASLNAFAGADSTTVAASSLSKYSNDVLKLMADVVLNPTFPQKQLDLQRQNLKQGLIQQRSQPAFLAQERLAKVLYGSNPYSVVSTTPAVLDTLTSEKLAAFYKRNYTPNNAVLIVIGDVNAADLRKDADALFGKWAAKGNTATANFSAPPTRTTRTIYVVDRPGSAQSNIILANLAFNRNDPDFFAATVMNQILGGGASGRLFLQLREKKDLTYGAYSDFDARRAAGNFESTAEVRTAVTGTALTEFFNELDRLRAESVSAQELTDAKNFLTGSFPIGLETQEGLTGQLVNIKTYNLPADYLTTYRDKINAVTAADVRRVANKYVTPQTMAVVIVGDAAQITDQIKPFAQTIEYYDTQGKPKSAPSAATPTATATNTTNSPAAIAGTWNLLVSSPQGDLPITMTLKNDNGKLNGTIESQIGQGQIENGTINGNKVTLPVAISFQGNPLELTLNGTIEGNSMKGNLQSTTPGFPELTFTGTKAN